MSVRIARRFGLVFEFASDTRGSAGQEQTIRDLIRRLEGNAAFHLVLWRLARKVKAERPLWAKAIPISWQFDIGANGWTFPYLMILNAALTPGPFLEYAFLHELGHLMGRHLLNPIDKTCLFADDFATWVMNGCSPNLFFARLAPLAEPSQGDLAG